MLVIGAGAFIAGSTFLIDGGATANYFYGPLQPWRFRLRKSRGHPLWPWGHGYRQDHPSGEQLSCALFICAADSVIMNKGKMTAQEYPFREQEKTIGERFVQRLLNDMTDVLFTGGGRGHWIIDGE